MKNLLIPFFALLFISSVSAQSSFNIGSFKVKKIDFRLGYETDMVDDLDAHYFVDQMPEGEIGRFSTLDLSPSNLNGGICENPSIELGFTLLHAKLPNVEWRNSFAFKANRRDAVNYFLPENDFYLNFSSRHNEYTLESSLMYTLPVFKFFNLYGGVGTQLGLVPTNELCYYAYGSSIADEDTRTSIDQFNNTAAVVSTNSFDHHGNCEDTGAQLNQRVFLQGGVGLLFFQKIEVGVDMKYGYGYRLDIGADAVGTKHVATSLSLRYILNN
jgi:hypothetical protein